MANPQLENGYLSIANELFEVIYMQYDFTKRQLKVLSTIIRYTYGWHQSECTISQREISAKTGITAWHVAEAIDELISYSVLEVTGQSNEKRTYKLIKNYDLWTAPKTGALPNREHERSQNGSSDAPETGAHTIKRKLKKHKESGSVFESLWERYPRKRGKSAVTKKARAEIDENAADVERALNAYLDEIERRNTDEQYIMHGSTFFNGRWRDYLGAAKDSGEQTEKEWKGRKFE